MNRPNYKKLTLLFLQVFLTALLVSSCSPKRKAIPNPEDSTTDKQESSNAPVLSDERDNKSKIKERCGHGWVELENERAVLRFQDNEGKAYRLSVAEESKRKILTKALTISSEEDLVTVLCVDGDLKVEATKIKAGLILVAHAQAGEQIDRKKALTSPAETVVSREGTVEVAKVCGEAWREMDGEESAFIFQTENLNVYQLKALNDELANEMEKNLELNLDEEGKGLRKVCIETSSVVSQEEVEEIGELLVQAITFEEFLSELEEAPPVNLTDEVVVSSDKGDQQGAIEVCGIAYNKKTLFGPVSWIKVKVEGKEKKFRLNSMHPEVEASFLQHLGFPKSEVPEREVCIRYLSQVEIETSQLDAVWIKYVKVSQD